MARWPSDMNGLIIHYTIYQKSQIGVAIVGVNCFAISYSFCAIQNIDNPIEADGKNENIFLIRVNTVWN